MNGLWSPGISFSLKDGKIYTEDMVSNPNRPSSEKLEQKRVGEEVNKTKEIMRNIVRLLEGYFRENKQFPDSLAELARDINVLDPFGDGEKFRFHVNDLPPVSAVIISNGPDGVLDYAGEQFLTPKTLWPFLVHWRCMIEIPGKETFIYVTTGDRAMNW